MFHPVTFVLLKLISIDNYVKYIRAFSRLFQAKLRIIELTANAHLNDDNHITTKIRIIVTMNMTANWSKVLYVHCFQ